MTYFSKISVDSKDRYMYEKRKESILEKVSLIESSEQKGKYEKASKQELQWHLSLQHMG